MSGVDTLPELYRPLMDGASMLTRWCVVCGRTHPLNRHHVVKRSAGKLYRGGVELPKPVLTLCGSGNAGGCHGKAHAGLLHFRWVSRQAYNAGKGMFWVGMAPLGGHWEYLETDAPVKYQDALEMDGWRRLAEPGEDWGC